MSRQLCLLAQAGGTATAQKTFFPPAWTLTSVVQAIYDAVVRRFQASGPIPSTLTTGETAERVKIRFVYEELAPRGKDVTTAYPIRGQKLTFAHQPVLRP